MFQCRTCEHTMTSESRKFPKEFLSDDFFSFLSKEPNDYTMVESYHIRLFNDWCKTNNYCNLCTIENIVYYNIFEGVQKDDDFVPNCPNCDNYYYEEFERAKKKAAENQALYAMGFKPKSMPMLTPIDDIHDMWMEYA